MIIHSPLLSDRLAAAPVSEGRMALRVTTTSLRMEAESRWREGTPGGYLKGRLHLLHLSRPLGLALSCVTQEGVAHPCHLLLPLFTRGRRAKQDHQHTTCCGQGCERKVDWRDMIGGKEAVRRLEVVGQRVLRGEEEVAEVVEEEGEAVVRLGDGEGELRVAIIQPIVKSAGSRKALLLEQINEVRVKVDFEDPISGEALCPPATSQAIKKETIKRKRKSDEHIVIPDGTISMQLPKPLLSAIPTWNTRIGDEAAQEDVGVLDQLEDLFLPSLQTGSLPDSDSRCPVAVSSEATMNTHIQGSKHSGYLLPYTDLLKYLQVDEDMEEGVEEIPTELHIFSLLEALAGNNLIDFNMERVLNKIRLTYKSEMVFETFSIDTNLPFYPRSMPAAPRHLVLHMFGAPLSPEGFQVARERVSRREILGHLPATATDREVRAELEGCRFSRTLNFNLERGLSYNYVLVIGAKGPLIWRMW